VRGHAHRARALAQHLPRGRRVQPMTARSSTARPRSGAAPGSGPSPSASPGCPAPSRRRRRVRHVGEGGLVEGLTPPGAPAGGRVDRPVAADRAHPAAEPVEVADEAPARPRGRAARSPR
jgi:hypothetical protein